MLSKTWLTLMVLLLLLTACAGQMATVETPPPSPFPEDPNWTPPPGGGGVEPPPEPYDPGKGDESMERSEVFVDSMEIVTLESFPPQFRLQVTGSLPTPCHQLRAMVDEPNEQNQIHVQIWSLVDPNTMCAQVLEPFEASIRLGSFESGEYTVFMNGEEVGMIKP